MEEVGNSDSDGVGGPKLEAGIISVDDEYQGGAVPEIVVVVMYFLRPLAFLNIPRGS